MKIRKGDMVKVMAGKSKGKTGKILLIDKKKDRVLVEKLNMVKRHQRPNQQHRQGGIIEKEAGIHISNVMYYDEKAANATKVGYKVVDGRKVRYSKKSGEVIVAGK